MILDRGADVFLAKRAEADGWVFKPLNAFKLRQAASALLARRLGLATDRICSATPATGNLGAVSLPAAWALRLLDESGPVIWTAVAPGLTWGAALTRPARK